MKYDINPYRRDQLNAQDNAMSIESILDDVASDLEDKYDGAPDSKTRWLADSIDRLRIAAERVAAARKLIGPFPRG